MVRTRDTAGVKAAGAKASRKIAPPAAHTSKGSSSSSDKNKYSGGNPVCPRETPAWQKPITNFFKSQDESGQSTGTSSDLLTAGSSADSPNETSEQSVANEPTDI